LRGPGLFADDGFVAALSSPIDILCKVVDNYGDIGVAYRLARALSAAEPGLRLRLIVEGLEAFSAICPEIDPRLPLQSLPGRGWTVIDWQEPGPEALALLAAEPPRAVIECFACGRPDWFEAALFDPGRPDEEESLVVNLEYLTGEDYARDLHLMASATRSGRVRKSFFMPGFEAGTGGLILDSPFMEARSAFLDPVRRPAARRALAEKADLGLAPGAEDAFWVSAFSYERDYGQVVADLAAHAGCLALDGAGGSEAAGKRELVALVAPGRSSACFLEAWRSAGKPFPVLELPFLPQETWDEVILASDLSIVRGEDSLSRAALSGRPFVWQAYLQGERYQLVKVRGLLERMRPFFSGSSPEKTPDFAALENLFLAFNDREADSPDSGGGEPLAPFLERLKSLEAGFRAFSESIVKIGDLARALLTFFHGFV
jgi:uncharacterized repeat protein (TIGR03837 family)